MSSKERSETLLEELYLIAWVSIWITSVLLDVFLTLSALIFVVVYPNPATLLCLGCIAFLACIPLEWTPTSLVAPIVRRSSEAGIKYFPLRVLLKDSTALRSDKRYIIGERFLCGLPLLSIFGMACGFDRADERNEGDQDPLGQRRMEPHSTIPVALPLAFNPFSPILPSQLKPIYGLATSLCFRMPIVRHLWYSLGIRSVSKQSMKALLDDGNSVVLIPGGIREIQKMRPDVEVAFLKNRYGFVKLAIQTGTPIVPAFVFGQSDTYKQMKWLPDGIANAIGRTIGVQPVYVFGRWKTTIPNRSPMLLVIGTPISVPHHSDPDTETIQKYLDEFVHQMSELFESYKVDAGYSELQLEIF